MTDGRTIEKQLYNGRIIGGCSIHHAHDAEKCARGLQHKGPWRTVECGGLAGEDRDIVECAECGEQRNVRCSFDEEYS